MSKIAFDSENFCQFKALSQPCAQRSQDFAICRRHYIGFENSDWFGCAFSPHSVRKNSSLFNAIFRARNLFWQQRKVLQCNCHSKRQKDARHFTMAKRLTRTSTPHSGWHIVHSNDEINISWWCGGFFSFGSLNRSWQFMTDFLRVPCQKQFLTVKNATLFTTSSSLGAHVRKTKIIMNTQ